jgi:four helix bundle protein
MVGRQWSVVNSQFSLSSGQWPVASQSSLNSWHGTCADWRMVFRSLEEMRVYTESLAAADAVSALLRRSPLTKDFDLADQLGRASGGVPANISEGYGQQTDRHFAHFLSVARGSCYETCTHLAVACGRNHILESERHALAVQYDRIGRQLTVLIRHLLKENRRRRG